MREVTKYPLGADVSYLGEASRRGCQQRPRARRCPRCVLTADVAPRSRRRRRLPSVLAVAALVGSPAATGLLIAARKTVDSLGRVPDVATHLSSGGAATETFLL